MNRFVDHALVMRMRLVPADSAEITKTGPFPDGHYLVIETGNEYKKLTRQGIQRSIRSGDVLVFRIDRRNIERIVQQLREDVEQLP